MIAGIGIDIIEVERIYKQLSGSKDRFNTMVFTDDELDYCRKVSNLNVQSQRFAARFAAKEAFFKAIGTGLRDGLQWKDVEVVNDDLGKPHFVLKGKALETIQKEKISNILLSLSHSKSNAVAVVILEKGLSIELDGSKE
jgi:holo-[acyl-carrier protein] synthase